MVNQLLLLKGNMIVVVLIREHNLLGNQEFL